MLPDAGSPWLLRLLRDVQLAQFYRPILEELNVTRPEHFDFVRPEDLDGIGMGRPGKRPRPPSQLLEGPPCSGPTPCSDTSLSQPSAGWPKLSRGTAQDRSLRTGSTRCVLVVGWQLGGSERLLQPVHRLGGVGRLEHTSDFLSSFQILGGLTPEHKETTVPAQSVAGLPELEVGLKCLIPQSAVCRGELLGSGCFGVVHRGLWTLPGGQSVSVQGTWGSPASPCVPRALSCCIPATVHLRVPLPASRSP